MYYCKLTKKLVLPWYLQQESCEILNWIWIFAERKLCSNGLGYLQATSQSHDFNMTTTKLPSTLYYIHLTINWSTHTLASSSKNSLWVVYKRRVPKVQKCSNISRSWDSFLRQLPGCISTQSLVRIISFIFFFISFIFLSRPKWLKLYAVYTTCHVVSLSSVYLSRHTSAGLLSYWN